MIDREKINKILDAMELLPDMDIDLSINQQGAMTANCYVKGWWGGQRLSEERRHEVLAILTPLVGRLEKEVDGTNIGYEGHSENLRITLNRVDKCTVVGYKTVKKTVRREIEKPVEYEEVEEEERVPITDCQIRMGQASESDIEVPA